MSQSKSQPRLQDYVDRLRSRLLFVDGLAAVCWSVLAIVATLLFAVWLDLLWDLPPRGRVAAFWVALALAAALLTRLGLAVAARLKPATLARRLDRAAGGSGVVLSGWELAQVKRSHPLPPGEVLTSGLAALAVNDATSAARSAPLQQAVSDLPLRWAAGSIAGVFVALILLAILLPSLTATQWRRFSSPFADVPPYSAIQFKVEPGNTDVVYGQGLDVNVTLSGPPVESVQLVVASKETESGKSAATLPMFPAGPGQWRATLARVHEPAQYHIAADRARSLKYKISVITTPNIESVKFRLTPPAYTRDAPYEGPLPKAGLVALAGTKVEVLAQSNRPLSRGEMQLELGSKQSQVELKPVTTGAANVKGEFTITAGGKFTLHVSDVDGQRSQSPLVGSITLLDDQRPFVRLMEPQSQSFATPTAALPVTLAAEDDYGVAGLQLYRNLNDSRPLPQDLVIERLPPRRRQEQVYLPLQQFGLRPGDVIKLFGRVEDNDPSGAKGAESAVVSVQIISQEEFERMLRVQQGLAVLLSKYQQAQRRLENIAAEIEKLQDELSKLPADSPAADEARKKLTDLAEQLKKEQAAIEEAAQHLLPYDLDKKLSEKLTDLAKAVGEAAEEATQMADAKDAKNGDLAKQLQKLAEKLGAKRKKFDEEAAQPLEHFAKVFPLMEDQARFVELVAAQKDLAERLAAVKGKDQVDDPALKARMRDLEREQLRLREELLELLDKIETHAKQLPDEEQFAKLWESALAFAAAVRGSGAADTMAEAEAGLAEFSGTKGHEKAAEAAKILEGFLKKCEGMGQEGEACLAFQPTLSQCLGDTVAQMLAEAGLGSGKEGGFGQGNGSGYSARRGGSSNVGLYGGMPGRSQQPGGSGGQGKAGQEGTGQFGSRNQTNDPSLQEASATGGAFGAAQGSAPLRYRQRVGQYIQRVNEEVKND
jgi:hypothetical protein